MLDISAHRDALLAALGEMAGTVALAQPRAREPLLVGF
jgi:hypothetical protein